MKYSIKKEKQKALITIQFDESDFNKADKITERYFSESLKVSGFRKGNIPRSVVLKQVGEEAFINETKNVLLNLAYTEVLKLEDLKPLMEPSVKDSAADFTTINLEVDLYPEIDISFLKDMSIKRDKAEVSEKDIKDTLDELLKQNKKYKEVSRGAKKGDKVEIDFDGFDKDNNSVKGASSKNHPIVIGMKTFIPGFEDNLVSMKKGDKEEFKLKFPKDYGSKELASKEVKFVVSMKRIEEEIKAEMNDEFAKEVSQGMVKNVKELKDMIKLRLSERREYDLEQKYQSDVIESFYNKLKFDLPSQFVDKEFAHMKNSLLNDLKDKGYTVEQYYEARKINEKKLDSELKEQALKRLKINLALKELIDAEKISLTDKEIKDIKDNSDKEKSLEQVESELIFQKALNYLFTKCDVKKT